MTESRRLTLAYAGLVFALVAPAAYVAQRLYGRARAAGVVNPAMILRSSHVEYHWRVAISTWFAVALALLLARGLATKPTGHRRLAIVGGFSCALCVALSWLYP